MFCIFRPPNPNLGVCFLNLRSSALSRVDGSAILRQIRAVSRPAPPRAQGVMGNSFVAVGFLSSMAEALAV